MLLLNKRLKDGLKGYWPLDDVAYDGTAGEVGDSSANTNDGEAQNGASTSAQKVGRGISFAATEYIIIPADASLAISGDLSISI